MTDPRSPPDRAEASLKPALFEAAPSPYRVLARKYRPSTFDDLIGQDAMVRTLSNAFETARIPQAWILTGVRGVGKTTTARILARALNYETAEQRAPAIRMPALGLHCGAIMESRHVDVIEMDAASHNGVDDVRQINDAVRYAPAQARYKVYILDEVHMLSTAAFNALLKTLEEPPPHVKFVFATTEIRKVPVTVLSRCQRFDLRRVEADTLVRHLAAICAAEGVTAEPDALALIARAAEGSVRDALSLLDQAIAHAGVVDAVLRAEDVRGMLGLADRTRVIALFEALMRGDVAAALAGLREQYDAGADAASVLTDLAEFTHFVTRVKIVPSVADDPSLPETERLRGRELAVALSVPALSRAWQILLKGIAETQTAPRPLAAAEMVLVRIAYAADVLTPDAVASLLGDGGGSRAPMRPATPAPEPAPAPAPAPAPVARAELRHDGGALRAAQPARGALAPRPDVAPSPRPAPSASLAPAPSVATPVRAVRSFPELIALAGERRDLAAKTALERDIRLVRFEDGVLEIALEPHASKALVQELARKLSAWTGRAWMVALSAEAGAPSVRQQAAERHEQLRSGIESDPFVQRVLAQFPGAKITRVQARDEEPDMAEQAGELAADDEL